MPGPCANSPPAAVLALLEKSRGFVVREAASFLGREFRRLEEFVVPGLRVKDLLTPHFVREKAPLAGEQPTSQRRS